jgi:4-hydroxybenzoate polyprenyltransferase
MAKQRSAAEDLESVAFCVDLDGTLLKSDLLYESLLALARRSPFSLLRLPWWLLRGKAALKHEIAMRTELDVASLPYDERVTALLRRTPGRPRVLCTASHEKFASAIAQHLGLFEEVMATSEATNLSGDRKAAALVQRFGERGFDYAGNVPVDLRIWARSRSAWIVNGSLGLASRAEQVAEVGGHLPAERGLVQAWVRQLRIHQWLKNVLVFLPLLVSHRFLEPRSLLAATLAFIAFSLCASGVYVLNDLLDLTSDRHHPRKRLRPFAAGRLPIIHGLVAAPILTVTGFAVAWLASPAFAGALVCYYAMTLAYSLRLKQVVMLDVFVLAGLYTVRIIGGAIAIASELSFWLLAFSMFLFLSLAMVKRYTELRDKAASGGTKPVGRGYTTDDLSMVQALGAASGYLAVLVLSLYINSADSLELYRRPQILWLVCPMMLYWVSRVWMVAHRGTMHDDPVVFAVTDGTSRLVIAITGLLVVSAI